MPRPGPPEGRQGDSGYENTSWAADHTSSLRQPLIRLEEMLHSCCTGPGREARGGELTWPRKKWGGKGGEPLGDPERGDNLGRVNVRSRVGEGSVGRRELWSIVGEGDWEQFSEENPNRVRLERYLMGSSGGEATYFKKELGRQPGGDTNGEVNNIRRENGEDTLTMREEGRRGPTVRN